MNNFFDLFILPSAGSIGPLLQSIREQNYPNIKVYIPSSIPFQSTHLNTTNLQTSESEYASDLLLRFFHSSSSPIIGLIPSNCILFPTSLPTIDRMLSNRPDVGWAFTDYELQEGSQQTRFSLLEDRGDLTEREDRSPCMWISRNAITRVGYVKSGLRITPLYDLRLRLGECYRTLHIPKVLVRQSIDVPKMTEEEKERAAKLFFPGQGKLGGFSYLFLSKDEESEIETVFYDSLKRRDVWLEGDTGIQDCPTDDTLTEIDPVVSVVIPVYNRAKYIGKAIESVLQGTYQNFEIIVVDNASTDTTIEIVQGYATRDKRIRIIKRTKNVIGEALNDGLFAARGIYFAQLDSDDLYSERTLELAVKALESDRKIGVAISYYDLVDEEGKVMPEFGVITHSQYNRNNILRRDGAGAARIWRKSVLLEFGGFDELSFGNYGEDYDMILKCGEKYKIHRLPEVLYHYRRHPDNTDALRQHSMKIWSKTEARQRAIIRRKHLNHRLGK